MGSLLSQLSEVVTENPPGNSMISAQTTSLHLLFLLNNLFVTCSLFSRKPDFISGTWWWLAAGEASEPVGH